jgi:hypothetical protein
MDAKKANTSIVSSKKRRKQTRQQGAVTVVM